MEDFSNPTSWVSFFLGILHEHKQQVFDCIYQHISPDQLYLVTAETSVDSHKQTNGEHFHVLIQCSDTIYRAIMTSIKKSFNLAGHSKGAQTRQYGKVRALRDVTRSAAYMLKQGPSLFSNIHPDTLEQFKALSFNKPKADEKEERSEIMRYLDQVIDLDKPSEVIQYINHSYYDTPKQVKKAIIEYHLNNVNLKFLTTHRLKYLTHYYLMYHRPNILNSEELLAILYN